MASVSRSDFLAMLVYSQLSDIVYSQAFNIVKNCDGDRFIIFTDSLSSLQGLDCNNYDHPFIQDILKLFNDCCSVNKKVVLAWVHSHVGIKGNEKQMSLPNRH